MVTDQNHLNAIDVMELVRYKMDALEYLKTRRDYVLRLGLRNICYGKDDIYYLIFYDIDKDSILEEFNQLDNIMKYYGLSYIIYTTKHGYHLICLTPVECEIWGIVFGKIKKLFKQKYAGNTIRLDRKDNEIKELKYLNTEYGYVIPNLHNLILNRLSNTSNHPRIECKPPFKHRLQIENYRSFKN